MPGPAGYAVGAVVIVAGVATAYVVKKHVWDPHIQPKVDQWVEEMKIKARAHRDSIRRRSSRTRVGVPVFDARPSTSGDNVTPAVKKDDAPEVEMTHVGASSSGGVLGGASEGGLRQRGQGRNEINEPNLQLSTPPLVPTPVRSPSPYTVRTATPSVRSPQRSLPTSPRVRSPPPAAQSPRSTQSMNPFEATLDRAQSPRPPSIVPSSPSASSMSMLSSMDSEDEELFANAESSQVLTVSHTGTFHTASDGNGQFGALGLSSPRSHASVTNSAPMSPRFATDAVLLSPMRPGSALSDDSGYQWVSPSITNSPRLS